MPLLPCPYCEQKIPVVSRQAGSQVVCDGCGKSVQIPNLGGLRRLEASAEDNSSKVSAARATKIAGDGGVGKRIVFAGLMAVAGTAAIVGIFCLVRFITIEVPATTESHIAEIERIYGQISPAQLVREWQQMEKFGLDVASPYQYKRLETEKDNWQRNGLICLATFLLSGLAAFFVAGSDRNTRNRESTPQTSTS